MSEGSGDVFGSEVGETDPFEGGEDWAAFGEPQKATEELPTVDREGEPVDPSQHYATEAKRAEDGYQYKVEKGEPVTEEETARHEAYVEQHREATPDEAAAKAAASSPLTDVADEDRAMPVEEPAIEPTSGAATPAEEVPANLRELAQREAEEKAAAEALQEPVGIGDEGTPVDAPDEVAETTPEVEALPDAARAASGAGPQTPGEPSALEAEPVAVAQEPQEVAATPTDVPATEDGNEEAPEPEDADLPEEPKDEKGRTTHRRYYVLQVSGPGKFTQVSWYEKDGKQVPRGTTGAKRQSVALARGSADALKVGYIALGAPAEGCTLVAVAALHFQPKRVRPKPPEPSKTQLEIS